MDFLYPDRFEKFLILNPDEAKLKLLEGPYTLKLFKRCPSHLLFFLTPIESSKPELCLKVYNTRFLKRNRIKAFYLAIERLRILKIAYLQPLALWWTNPLKAFLKGLPFYGAILFSYLERGFLKVEDFILPPSQINLNLLSNLIQFLFNLHNKGIMLGDSKVSNFYYSEKEGFKIFDLDGIKFKGKALTQEERIMDLIPFIKSFWRSGLKNFDNEVFNLYKEYYKDLNFRKFKQNITFSITKK